MSSPSSLDAALASTTPMPSQGHDPQLGRETDGSGVIQFGRDALGEFAHGSGAPATRPQQVEQPEPVQEPVLQVPGLANVSGNSGESLASSATVDSRF